MLTGADLRESNVAGVSVDGATTCKRLNEGYGTDHATAKFLPIGRRQLHKVFQLGRRLYEGSQFDSQDWDTTAIAYHDLKTVFSGHGLIGKARAMYVRERRARSLEAKAAHGWINRSRYLRSLPSRIFTGYGVQIRNLVFWMVALFLVSTAWYVSVGVEDTLVANVSYSVLAFTVAPPQVPEGVETQIVVMVETFFGTLSIVLLGYILGNRERF